jgi:hypothetical protein
MIYRLSFTLLVHYQLHRKKKEDDLLYISRLNSEKMDTLICGIHIHVFNRLYLRGSQLMFSQITKMFQFILFGFYHKLKTKNRKQKTTIASLRLISFLLKKCPLAFLRNSIFLKMYLAFLHKS